jgi:hypothetical protein
MPIVTQIRLRCELAKEQPVCEQRCRIAWLPLSSRKIERCVQTPERRHRHRVFGVSPPADPLFKHLTHLFVSVSLHRWLA